MLFDIKTSKHKKSLAKIALNKKHIHGDKKKKMQKIPFKEH